MNSLGIRTRTLIAISTVWAGLVLASGAAAQIPVVAWSCDEGQGDTLGDTFEGHDATLGTSVTWEFAGAWSGTSISFLGEANSTVSTSLEPVFTPADGFILDLAFMDLPPGGSGGKEVILGFEETSNQEFTFAIDTNDRTAVFLFRDDAHNATSVRTSTPIDVGVWHRVRIIRDVDLDSLWLYVDGELVDQAQDNTVTDVNATDPRTITLGANNHSSSEQHYFSGLIDEVKLYLKPSAYAGMEWDHEVPPIIQSYARPNPMMSETAFHLSLPGSGPASVQLFDPSGRLVRDLSPDRLGQGNHLVKWDGRDGRGIPVGSGVFFYSVRQGVASGGGNIVVQR